MGPLAEERQCSGREVHADAEEGFAGQGVGVWKVFLPYQAFLYLSGGERVQVPVADAAVERAMEVIRPRLSDGDELPAVRAGEFRRELVLKKRELLHHFR